MYFIKMFQLEDALRMIRRETETSHGRLRHEKEKLKKHSEIQTVDFARKTAEYESRSTRQQGFTQKKTFSIFPSNTAV